MVSGFYISTNSDKIWIKSIGIEDYKLFHVFDSSRKVSSPKKGKIGGVLLLCYKSEAIYKNIPFNCHWGINISIDASNEFKIVYQKV